MSGKTAAIYLRCSTPGQVKGSSLVRQLAYCKAWCEDNGVSVSEIVTDIGSGYDRFHLEEHYSTKKGNLGNFLRRLECGDSKTDYLVYEETDRLTRSVLTYLEIRQALKKVGVKDQCVGMENYDITWPIEFSDYEKQMTYQA